MSSSTAEYTLQKDGFVILPLTVPCAFADSSAFWNYLNSLPELDFTTAGVQSLQEMKASHLGNDPRGILPFASTFHHVWNRDLRAIAYIHALRSIYEYFQATSEEELLPKLFIEQLFDGFSVRGPGKHIPKKSARDSKLAIPYSFLRESDERMNRYHIMHGGSYRPLGKARQQIIDMASEFYDQAVENTRQLWNDLFGKNVFPSILEDENEEEEEEEEKEELPAFDENTDNPATVHLGDDELDFETCDREKEIARKFHRRFPNQWLFHGWMNLSFHANKDHPIPALLDQFMTYIPNSHISSDDDDGEEEEQRVKVPPNCMILIHPRLKTSLVKGTIHHSYLIRQYVSFRVVESTSSSRTPKSLFSDETRELTLSQLRVPFLANGHRPCVFRFADLDDHRNADARMQDFRDFTKVLSRPFRMIYHYVANNSLYARLEERLLSELSTEDDNLQSIHDMIEDPHGPSVFPPKIMIHLQLDQEEYAEEDRTMRLFSSYTPLDLEMVWSMRSLQDDMEAIDEESLTKEVEHLVMSREGKGFAEWSQSAVKEGNQEEDDDDGHESVHSESESDEDETEEEEQEEEQEDEDLLLISRDGGTTKVNSSSTKNPDWNYKNLVWSNKPEFVPLFRREQDILALKRIYDLKLSDQITPDDIIVLDKNKNSYWLKQSVRITHADKLSLQELSQKLSIRRR